MSQYEITLGELKKLIATLPIEADEYPVSANDEYGVTGLELLEAHFNRKPRINLLCY